MRVWSLGRVWVGMLGLLGAVLFVGSSSFGGAADAPKAGKKEKAVEAVHPKGADPSYEHDVPSERLKRAFRDEVPITFVTFTENAAEWQKLPQFWNETTETARAPRTGTAVTRKAVKIKVPLGLTRGPAAPPENPLTVEKWALGKQIYFDHILSSDGTVSCATCHNPRLGYTDQSPVSTGIFGKKGGVSAPTVINSAYNLLQFWDGRALSLEDQMQGPPQNALEMFSGEGDAWVQVVRRVRSKEAYVKAFQDVFGHAPTRDAIAKAVASYERTVLSGNSFNDRAELAMKQRIIEEETVDQTVKPKDYEKVLKAALETKADLPALQALGFDPAQGAAQVAELAKRLSNGRAVFFGKARCNSCHVGDNYTDNLFHNLGVGVKDGVIPKDGQGRYARLPTGHKNPELIGAFKTPTLRALVATAPYLHDGSEATLEKVVDFYDRGGNANEFLDAKMRDFEAEKAYLLSRENKTPYKGPEVKLFGKDQVPVVPLKLNLTPDEKKHLVLFLRALQGDPIDPVVADPERLPRTQSASSK